MPCCEAHSVTCRPGRWPKGHNLGSYDLITDCSCGIIDVLEFKDRCVDSCCHAIADSLILCRTLLALLVVLIPRFNLLQNSCCMTKYATIMLSSYAQAFVTPQVTPGQCQP